jgi:hypothetical protein
MDERRPITCHLERETESVVDSIGPGRVACSRARAVIFILGERAMKELTEEQQKGMAVHVKYEIDQFRDSIVELARLKVAGRRDSAWDRTLESALLHFRNLRDFFYCGPKPHKHGVFAIHYVPSWNAKQDDAVFKKTHGRLNARLAHLSIRRLDDPSDWPELDQMKAAIEKLISKFKESLPPEKASWFKGLDAPKSPPTLGYFDNSTATVNRRLSFFDRWFCLDSKLRRNIAR